MPDIFNFDKEEFLNRFRNKYILYVEGPGDRNAYRQIVGTEFLIDFDFQLPPGDKRGANAVRKRVQEERVRNPRVFGFLDGEAAAALGKVAHLMRCDDLLFQIEDDEHCKGLIFVAAHEIENLILAYCDVAPTIAAQRPLARLNDGEADRIRERLGELAGRFLVAAIFKYTSLHMQHEGHCIHVANTKPFATNADLKTLLGEMKKIVTTQCELDWSAFTTELFAITRMLREQIAATTPPAIPTPLRHLRLADGKQLLRSLRGQVPDSVEGHLLGVLARSTFAGDLRDAIRNVVDAADA